MKSTLTMKWLGRLERPRSIDSLISEVYGECMMFGCLFEREVADLLNYRDLATDPMRALSRKPFDTECGLNSLIKEVGKRKFLSDESLEILDNGREARNEIAHRLIGEEFVISRAEKEMIVEKMADLFARIWKAHRLAMDVKKEFAAKVGVTDEKARQFVRVREESAKIEDENIRRITEHDD